MSKIDDFKEYARRRIVERLREDKNHQEPEESQIQSYDEEDSFYTGSDEEYKEFLDGLDVEMNDPAEPVENTQRINLGETINVKEVLEKVKEKAGNLAGAAAAKVSEAADKTATMRFKIHENDETQFEKVGDTISADLDNMKNELTDTMNDSMQKLDGLDERLGGVSEIFADATKNIVEMKEAAAALEKRIQGLELQSSETSDRFSAEIADLKHEIGTLRETAEQIRDAVNGVSKLSDSVFDMKNAQQNTKTALTELHTAFSRLKKKTVTGIVILSIIGLITIALEVINLLS